MDLREVSTEGRGRMRMGDQDEEVGIFVHMMVWLALRVGH